MKLDVSDDEVEISSAYSEKYGVEKGDTITLKDPYGSDKYKFKVGGIYDYPSTIAVFMDRSLYNVTKMIPTSMRTSRMRRSQTLMMQRLPRKSLWMI